MRSPAKADWQMAMCAVAEDQAGVNWMAFELDAALMERAFGIGRAKIFSSRLQSER